MTAQDNRRAWSRVAWSLTAAPRPRVCPLPSSTRRLQLALCRARIEKPPDLGRLQLFSENGCRGDAEVIQLAVTHAQGLGLSFRIAWPMQIGNAHGIFFAGHRNGFAI